MIRPFNGASTVYGLCFLLGEDSPSSVLLNTVQVCSGNLHRGQRNHLPVFKPGFWGHMTCEEFLPNSVRAQIMPRVPWLLET